jgi:hypothetical protein
MATFNGTLQADQYAGLNRLYDSRQIRGSACWAHVRAQVVQCSSGAPLSDCDAAMERIGQLCAIEKEIRGCSPDDEHAAKNYFRGKPFLNSRGRDLGRSEVALMAGCSRKFVNALRAGEIWRASLKALHC